MTERFRLDYMHVITGTNIMTQPVPLPPQGACDRTDRPELQWHRDGLWFETWARYAWNPNREPPTVA